MLSLFQTCAAKGFHSQAEVREIRINRFASWNRKRRILFSKRILIIAIIKAPANAAIFN